MSRVRDHGLTLALMILFLFSVAGQVFTGFHTYNDELAHQMRPVLTSLAEYLRSAHFRSSLFENWESEFLQMAIFVYLTIFLFQKGSSESKPPPGEKPEPVKYPRRRYFRHQPWLRKAYEHSLGASLMILFIISIFMHAQGSHDLINEENAHFNKPLIGFWETFKQSQFWFESFQNWQSEFFSMAVLIVLSIFLREKDSAQSKEPDAPHQKTGQ